MQEKGEQRVSYLLIIGISGPIRNPALVAKIEVIL